MSDSIESELYEEWKPIQGHPGYEVSNLARVRSVDRTRKTKGGFMCKVKGRILRQGLLNGYPNLALGKKSPGRTTYSVHRLMAIEFIPNPKKLPAINHKNGIKTDNRLENLEWVSNSENHIHRCRVLGKGLGSSHGNSSLTEGGIPKIMELRKNGLTYYAIANRFGVSYQTIHRAVKGISWLHVDTPRSLSKQRGYLRS